MEVLVHASTFVYHERGQRVKIPKREINKAADR